MRGGIPKRFVSATLLVALTPWCVGCAHGVYVTREAGSGDESVGGALEVRVFENRADLHHYAVSSRKVLTELYRAESHSEVPVRQETASHWSASGLAPGRYALRIHWSGEAAKTGAPSSAHEKLFVIRAGQRTVVDVVVKDARKTWIRVAIGAAVVIAATYYLAYQEMKSWDPLGGLSLH